MARFITLIIFAWLFSCQFKGSSVNAQPSGYCSPIHASPSDNDPFSSGDFVQRVQLAGFNSTAISSFVNSVSSQSQYSPCYPNCPYTMSPYYEVWPAIPGLTAQLARGVTYTISIQVGSWYSNNHVQAWIDFNANGSFEPGERLGPSFTSALNANQWVSYVFAVPESVTLGATRMRVREVFNVANIDPCLTYSFGEAEDFEVVLVPNCPFGKNLWRGNSESWTDPLNWCDGVPDSDDIVEINRNSIHLAGSSGYHAPVIGSGVKAAVKELLISSADTLYVDAVEPSDTCIVVHRDFNLSGGFITRSTADSSIVIGNGTQESSIYTPFRGTVSDVRMQLIFSKTELAALGLTKFDQITNISFEVIPLLSNGQPGKNSSQPFNSFTVSYGLVSETITEFSDPNPLPTPFIAFGPIGFSTVSGQNNIPLSTPVVWDGVSSLVLQFCFDNSSITGSDFVYITPTIGRKTALMLNSSTVAGCSLVPGAGVSDNFFATSAVNRPNLVFSTNRIYGKPLLAIAGDWVNNGSFIPGKSIVLFKGGAQQNIAGNSATTFHELSIEKTSIGDRVDLLSDIVVEDTLYLNQGSLWLNDKTLTITNPEGVLNYSGNSVSSFSGPISRLNGLIIGEDSLAKVKWFSPASTPFGTYRVIPFGNSDLTYIPFSYRQVSGDLGFLTVSTYASSILNQSYPPSVFHMNNVNANPTDNSTAAIDRFWIIGKGNSTAIADIAFRWSATEKNSVNPAFHSVLNPPRAYPWRRSDNGVGTWAKIYSSPSNAAQLLVSTAFTQNSNSGFDSVVVRNFNWPDFLSGNSPWLAPAQPMHNPASWVVAGSSANGALGSGLVPVSIQLGVYLQGLYQGSRLMNDMLAEGIADTIALELHSPVSPYALVYSAKAVLNASGVSNFLFPNAALGNSYYLVVRHRNSLATWSKLPVLIGSFTSYDFTQ